MKNYMVRITVEVPIRSNTKAGAMAAARKAGNRLRIEPYVTLNTCVKGQVRGRKKYVEVEDVSTFSDNP